MSRDHEIRRLTEHLRALGARCPESWAESQVDEDIPQYARFVFLREAWSNVVREEDTSWIDWHIHASTLQPRDPGAGAGLALNRLLSVGASRDDIAEVVRVMQWQLLHAIVYQIEDSGVVEYPSNECPRVHWELFEIDDAGEPLHPISGLHESILDTDPTGREMRPRRVGRDE